MKEINANELNLMISVIKKYYELGMNQAQIAKEEFISKSSVCRLLKKAEEYGYVKHQISYPVETSGILENEVCRVFSLEKAIISHVYADNEEVLLNDTCTSVVHDLCKIVKAKDIIGVAWGVTIEHLVKAMKKMPRVKKCEKVVLIIGSIAGTITSTVSSNIVEEISDYFSAKGYLLPLPLIVDSESIANTIKEDSHIKEVLDLARESQIVLLGIGTVEGGSVLRTRGALSEEELKSVIEKGAVASVAGHCVDIDGKEVSSELSSRMTGLSIEEIKAKPIRIGIAVGKSKARAIIGALNSGIINRFYSDESTVKEVFKILKSEDKQ